MPNIEKEKLDDFYSNCFDWYGTDSNYTQNMQNLD